MGLVGEADGYRHFGGGHTVGEKCLGAPQTDGHQHLMGRHVIVGFKLALKVVRAKRRHLRQLVEGDGAHIVIVQVVAHPVEAMPGLTLRRGMVGQRAEGVDEVEQQSLLGQRIVAMPQAINQLANLSGNAGDPRGPPR